MDRAARRQRRLEQKVGRGGNLQASETSSWQPKANISKFCSCGLRKGQSSTFRAGPAGPNSLCDACGLQLARKGTLRGVQNESQEKGTDGAPVYNERGEGNLSLKDLQAQLHLSDAREMKWQKIAAERLEENKELRTGESKWQKIAAERLEENKELRAAESKWQKIAAEWSEENKGLRIEIQCLNGKLKKTTEAKAVHKQFESRLRADIQILNERNDELIKSVDNWVKHYSSLVSEMEHLVKHHSSPPSSEMENLTQIGQSAKSNRQSTQYHASQGAGNAGRYVHEATAEVNVCTGVSSRQTGYVDRHGCDSEADLNVDVEQQISDTPHRQTRHSGGHGSKIAQPMDVDGGPNECLLKTEKSVHGEKRIHDSEADETIDIGCQGSEDDAGMASGLQKAPSIGNVSPGGIPPEDVSEVLFTSSERKRALSLVSSEFLIWLNSRTRRPNSEEMSLHKSQVMQLEDAHWTGLSERHLLDKFHADTEMEKPSSNALTTLLRSVLHILGSKRRDDMSWCLVWADCMDPAQLPGYINSQHDTKRARASYDEVATRSAKARQS